MDSVNFLRGYVCIRAEGGFPERFLNLCSRGRIPYWDVCCTGNTIFARTTPSGYRRMRACAKKSGMHLCIKKKCGLPFLIFKNRAHMGLAIGAVCFVMTVTALSGRVWTVSVTGCESILEEDITAIAAELGIRPGIKKDRIDSHALSEQAMSKLPNVSWFSINISGCAANIEIREGVGKAVKNDDTPCDIVAAADGQIQTIEVFSGTAMQTQNAAVLKGDVIISGLVENRDGGFSTRHAAGYITALTEQTVSSHAQQTPAKRIAAVKSRHTLIFFSFRLPLGKPLSADFTEESFLTLAGTKLPIGIKTERQYIYVSDSQTDKSLANLICLEQYFCESAEKFRNAKVMSRRTTQTQKDGLIALSGSYNCLQNIGEERAIQMENGQ